MKRPFCRFLVLFLSAITSCKEPFSPEIDANFKEVLVVEGYLNIGGSTSFVLSRSGGLKDYRARIPEPNAQIEVHGEDGTVLNGTSDENGFCWLSTTGLDINRRYRVVIITKNGKVYQTNFLESKRTPAIDSISRRVENNGFKLYVSTHDASGKAKYYSWDFHETWEIVSPVLAKLDYVNGKFVDRDPNINISRCWQNRTSSEILLASSERLSEDRVSMSPLVFIEGNSVKLEQMYSILVRQYAHSREGYQYLENMKKNTEKIGTIFDPQPSEIRGNITCVSHPKEQVIGWIDAGTVAEKRIFIGRRERLPGWTYSYKDCTVVQVPLDSVPNFILFGYLVDQLALTQKVGAYMAKAKCIDCRLLGSNVKPSFWPN
jgi:hypothetical protein